MKKNTNSNEQKTKGLRPNPMSERVSSSTNTQKSPQDSNVFGEVIFTYSRKDALADGVQIDVTETATECGFRIPVFLTASVYHALIHVPVGTHDASEFAKLWYLLSVLHSEIRNIEAEEARITFVINARRNNQQIERVTLHAIIGSKDFDDPTPAITITIPNED